MSASTRSSDVRTRFATGLVLWTLESLDNDLSVLAAHRLVVRAAGNNRTITTVSVKKCRACAHAGQIGCKARVGPFTEDCGARLSTRLLRRSALCWKHRDHNTTLRPRTRRATVHRPERRCLSRVRVCATSSRSARFVEARGSASWGLASGVSIVQASMCV